MKINEKLSRRRILKAMGTGTVAALAGCTSNQGDGGNGITVETPDGSTKCIKPIESNQSVQEYYGYERNPRDSSSTTGSLEVEDVSVTFLYRDTQSGNLSLVFLNGNGSSTSNNGGNAIMSFKNVKGYQWQVQDGLHGTGSGDRDPYKTPKGKFNDTEKVIWGWEDSKTDGGAFGPLGEEFEVEIIHRPSGSMSGRSRNRKGLKKWLFVSGDDTENPIEVANLSETSGNVSVTVSTGGC